MTYLSNFLVSIFHIFERSLQTATACKLLGKRFQLSVSNRASIRSSHLAYYLRVVAEKRAIFLPDD